MEIYKEKTKFSYDKKVIKQPLHVGDWVLCKIEVTGKALEANKLTPNWEGPYKIQNEVKPGTYRLINEEGVLLPNPWHSDHLKKYYV